MPFLDRADAGRRLASLLASQPAIVRGAGSVVLGLPRGGIPVAYEIARALDAPLDVILVRKVGLPAQPELAMGAIGEDGVRVVNDEVVRAERVTERQFAGVEELERAELGRRAERYRADHPRVPLAGKTAIVVDDGIATGSTARAACQVARAHGAARVVLAVPLAPQASIDALASVADDVVCAEVPEPFLAIGQWYVDFAQTADAEVVDLLKRAGQGPGADDWAPAERDVIVLAGTVPLPGRLTVPAGARGVVVFAHGSGSGRSSPRNMFVASALHVAGLGSLLFDLLTPDEEADRANVFDIGLLAGRCPRPPAGSAASRGWNGSRSATSGPAPGRPRRCGPPPNPPSPTLPPGPAPPAITGRSRPWSPGVAVPTWPGRRWARWRPPRCSSWAGWTTGSSNSTRPPGRSCAARAGSWSSRARATCSPSPGRWSRWRPWPGTGSRIICTRNRRPGLARFRAWPPGTPSAGATARC